MRDGRLHVLMLGNSFTHDAVSYVPHMLQTLAPDFKFDITVAYYTGCGLERHYVNMTGEARKGISPNTYRVTRCDEQTEAWQELGQMEWADILALDQWDLVTLQQRGADAWQSYYTYFKPYLPELVMHIRSVAPDAFFGWMLTQGAYADSFEEQEAHWEGTALNSQKVAEAFPGTIVIPYGTAVQNLRQCPELREVGQDIGMTVDGNHLQEGLPTLAASYCTMLSLLQFAGAELPDCVGDRSTIPGWDFNKKINCLTPNYGEKPENFAYVRTEEGRIDYTWFDVAQKAAHAAITNPYTLTTIE